MPVDTSALLAHIVSQTRQNVEFLMAQDEISRDAGQRILAQLPNSSDVALRDLSEQTRRMAIPTPSPQPPIHYDPPSAPEPGPPARRNTQQPPSLQQAKALWAYNENGSVGNPPVNGRLSAEGMYPRNLMIYPSALAILSR
jgi:LAS seventeen-binding protein 1/2